MSDPTPPCSCGISRVGATDLGIDHRRYPDECVALPGPRITTAQSQDGAA